MKTMSNNKSTQKTTFWNFLQNNNIEIPIIQRDYAQGRSGKEYLRKTFLSDIKESLDSEKEMKLDFVYGSKENGNLNPLDGQQRLTTLWLLHWYISLMAGKLNDDTCQTLKKFSYETRISSRVFCDELCKFENFKDFDGSNIVGYITSCTWFYSSWKQDPTIQAMLRMLGGSKNDKKENNHDGIEQVFCYYCNACFKNERDIFGRYWDKLISHYCPIVFYYLSLNEFKLTDDLYIKMNARGEQLTSFENFKADLIGYIQEKIEETSSEEKKKWENLISPDKGIPKLMDTTWTDIFWKNKSESCNIDEIYYAFLNRFFLNFYFYIKDIKDENDELYSFLTNKGQDAGDNGIEYKTIEQYKYNGEIKKELFEDLTKILNNYHDSQIEVKYLESPWKDEKNFRFIPEYEEGFYDKDKKIYKFKTINQKERIAFYAICKYFKEGPVEKKEGSDEKDYSSLKHWMRFVWNLISVKTADGNDSIRSVSEMINAINLIDEIKTTHNVYSELREKDSQNFYGSLLKEQFAEEIKKAKQICKGGARSDGESWENLIVRAENHAFFKGSIRFLFQDANGQPKWDEFDKKWEKAQIYFEMEGIKENYKIDLTKALVVQCDDWSKQLDDKQIFNPNASTWRWILCSPIWRKPVNEILLTDLQHIQKSQSLNDDTANKYIIPILDKFPYEAFVKDEPTGRFRKYGSRLAYYKPYGRRYIIFDWNDFSRNELLRELKNDISIDKNNNPEINNSILSFWWGWDINFKYNDYYFRWLASPDKNTELDVYLMEENWTDYKKREVPKTDKGTDEVSYYCFNVTDNMTSDGFKKSLKNLITDFKNAEKK